MDRPQGKAEFADALHRRRARGRRAHRYLRLRDDAGGAGATADRGRRHLVRGRLRAGLCARPLSSPRQGRGPGSEENGEVERFHEEHKPRGSIVTVIGSATASEEIIEGIALGAGAAVNTGTAIVIGIALVIDNVSEAMSLGALSLDGKEEKPKKATMWWTSAVGVSLFVSAMAGWFVLRGLPQWALGGLLALGAGAMFNLTIADMIPAADSHQYQRSSAIATAGGFLVAMVLANLQ